VKSLPEALSFSVQDTGVGIHHADVERIFFPFERVQTVSNHQSKGIGVGLAITRILAEKMGGTVHVESKFGRGSTFTFTIPVAVISMAGDTEQSNPTIIGYRGKRLTILVTDDEPTHCQLVKDILEPIGFTVLTAANANECLKLTQDLEPDIFLLDISMPGMNGMDLATALRKNKNNTVPIIMISANTEDSIGSKTDKGCHNDYLMKPIGHDRFLDKIKNNLHIQWVYQGLLHEYSRQENTPVILINRPPPEHIESLKKLGKIGHVRKIKSKLDKLEAEFPDCSIFFMRLRKFTTDFNLTSYMAELEHDHE
jgi:CheY-like chemotaxis protein